jgi:hypothetical protein
VPIAPILDHLVVAARDLEAGVEWVASRLGATPSPGGEHEQFGTHNALLSLGSAYLEVIAPNPAAAPSARPRWFGLDTPETHARLEQGPRLLHWVVGLPDLPAGRVELHGDVLKLRRGDLSWRLTVPADGVLPLHGTLPSLISWDSSHPTEQLDDVGVRLESLTLTTHDARTLAQRLDAVSSLHLADVRGGPPALTARLRTSAGEVVVLGEE